MGPLKALHRLDRRVVPQLARGLARMSAAARRRRVPPLTAIAMVLVLAVAGTALWRLTRPMPLSGGGTSPTWVGVRDGDSVPAYVDSARAELGTLAVQGPQAPVYALISLARYLTPTEVTSVAELDGLRTVYAYARVPLPGRQTERVVLAATRLPGDLAADMARVADRKEVDAATYDRLAGAETSSQLRAIYMSNAEVSRAEARAYRSGCGCVFAMVVRAAPDGLATLARQDDVRAVDPAPEVADPRDAVFVAPLPEQTDRVEPPADTLPTPGPGAYAS